LFGLGATPRTRAREGNIRLGASDDGFFLTKSDGSKAIQADSAKCLGLAHLQV
jgi:hypothetical protein